MRKWTRSPDLPYLLALAALFAVSRVVFRLVGVRFSTDQLRIAIQYLDPELLRHHLAQSVWYLHTQPPLYNLFLGVVLKLFPGHEGLAFHAVHLALGLAFCLALYLLLAGFSLPRPAAAAIALAVSVSPAAILYENRLFYDYPVLVLLTLAALAAQRLARRPTVTAALTFPPYVTRSPSLIARLLADARVSPRRSSMSWAAMCLLLRKTLSRGRSAVPRMRRRTWRRRRSCCLRLAF